MKPIAGVATNIITGFLGAGKTTTISHLLQHKPAAESWAVLVNEFGDVGVDGSLFRGEHSEPGGVFVREVPGGCMCCAAGLPMQVALNQLLTRAKPARLLIEPTGLGHPREVEAVLSAPHYRSVLNLQATVTLVDARKFSEQRYTANATFHQQLTIADVIVANKSDLCSGADFARMHAYLAQQGMQNKKVTYAERGAVAFELLQLQRLGRSLGFAHSANAKPPISLAPVGQANAQAGAWLEPDPLPESGYQQLMNQGEGFESTGWRFAPRLVFDYQTLYAWLMGLSVERMKAVFITERGVFGFNMAGDTLLELPLDDCMESRIEFIGINVHRKATHWQQALLGCLRRV